MKKTTLVILAAVGATTAVMAQTPTAMVQDGYGLESVYTVPGIADESNSRSGIGIHDRFFVNYHANGIRVYNKDGQLEKTIAPTTGYFNWVNSNVDGAGNLIAQLDVKAFDGNPSAGGKHGFMVIDTKTTDVVKDFVSIGGGYPTRNDIMQPVAKNILTDDNVNLFSVLSGVANSYVNPYNKGVLGTTVAMATNSHLGDFAGTKANAQTSTGQAMEFIGVDGSISMAVYSNHQYEVTFSGEEKYGNAIAHYKASGTSYVDGKEYFYTPMHSGCPGYNFFTLGGKQYIIYPAMDPNGDRTGVNAPDNRPGDAFAIAEVSTVASPVTDLTMEGETLVDGKPVGKLVAIFPGASKAGNSSTNNSYTIEPVEGEENSVYIYVFSSVSPGYKWKFTVPASEVVIPGNNAIYADVISNTYTQRMDADNPRDYDYNTLYTIKYNTDRTLTLTSKYFWNGNLPVGTETFSYISVNGKEMKADPIGAEVTTEDVYNYGDEVTVHFKLPVALGAIEDDVTYKVGEAHDLTVQPSTQSVITQDGYTLTELKRTQALKDQSDVRSGVGMNYKFYINNKSQGVVVYDVDGNVEKTIAPTEGYHNWVSSNLDAGGHLLAQLDVKAFDGNCSVYPNHGFMIIDTETGEVLKDYLPMGNETPSPLLGEVSSRRYDSMAPLAKNILTDQNVRIITPYNAMRAANQNSYNSTTGDVAEFPQYWKFAEFLAHETVANTSTAYALEYFSFDDPSKTEMALYHAPNYSTTFSAAGNEGNSIRRCTGNWTLTNDYFYTPMHSGLTGYNIFTIGEKHYIIYPAINTNAAVNKDNRPADAFAIAEISFVDSPNTDMNMPGEVLIGGNLVGTIKALFQGSENVLSGSTSCTPSFSIEPIYGQDNSVLIYAFNPGAPAYVWRFTVGEEAELPAETIVINKDQDEGVKVTRDGNNVTIEAPYSVSESLVGRKVEVKLDGVHHSYITAEANGICSITFEDIENELLTKATLPTRTLTMVCRSGQNEISFDIPTGVETITFEQNAPAVYYNMQGIRVERPLNGFYIVKQGNKVIKVIR